MGRKMKTWGSGDDMSLTLSFGIVVLASTSGCYVVESLSVVFLRSFSFAGMIFQHVWFCLNMGFFLLAYTITWYFIFLFSFLDTYPHLDVVKMVYDR